MVALVNVALLGWIVVGVVLFAKLPRAHALLMTFVAGWLFLPVVQEFVDNEGMPPALSAMFLILTKVNAISYGALIGSLAFDFRRWLKFRPRWFDLPVIALCVSPF